MMRARRVFWRWGDRVVFFEGRHGIDYRATVYDLDSRERCELLLRGRLYQR